MGLNELRILSGRYILVEQDEDSGDPVDDEEIILDVVSGFEHGRSAEVTVHAVEDGADVADNIKINPYSISLTAVISDSKSITDQIIDQKSIDDKRDRLIKWHDEKTLVSLVGDETYIDLYIRDLSEVREAGLGNALQYSMTLQQIIIAEAATSGNAKGKQSKGSDTATDSQLSSMQGAA